MFKISLLFEYPTLNGGERSMLAVLDELQSKGFEFTALAPARGPLAAELAAREIEHIPLDLHNASGSRCRVEDAFRSIRPLIEKLNPDLLHANSLSMARFTGVLAPVITCPASAHIRDIIKLSRPAIEDINQNQILIAVSQATAEHHKAQGISAERLSVIRDGINMNTYTQRPREGFLRKELGLTEEAFLSATIGQIGLRKGLDVLAQAATQVAQTAPNAHFVIIGERHSSKAESIAFEKALQQKFTDNDISGRLHFLGYRLDVPRLLGEIDLLVHPAKQEPLGLVIIEAAAAGVPILATRVGGIAEIVEDQVSARLVPANDPRALSDAFLELYQNKTLREQLKRTAALTVRENFQAKDTATKTAKIWGRLISGADS